MLFSEHFGVAHAEDDPWFDPLLTLDTALYVDPLLIFQDEFGPFVGAHKELVSVYQAAFELIAQSGSKKSEPHWSKAINILRAPEVSELCLGVTEKGTRGAGASKGKAKAIAEAIFRAVQFGISNPAHFETLQLFQKGIAEDTVSDAVGNILRHRFAEYTKTVCDQLGVPTVKRKHLRGQFDSTTDRWVPIDCEAPLNPYSKEKKQVFLCPKQYLRPMPTLNPNTFWGYCFDQEAEQLRIEFGEDITRNVDKEVILEKALEDYDSVQKFVKMLEETGGTPYDLEKDPKGLVRWYYATKRQAQENPLKLEFKTQVEFESFVDQIISVFKNYVENQGGWDLIHNDDGSPKSEAAVQRLFLGIVKHYCFANDIDITPEANIGRGPVDFKIGRGVKFRALIEVKLANNSKFWGGLKKQLPKYLEAEEVSIGRYLIIAFNEKDVGRLANAYEQISDVAASLPYQVSHEVVDAVFKPDSASKL